jgi:hypothetical protein
MATDTTTDDDVLAAYALRLNGNAWGVSIGMICAIGLFIATNVLVLKGGDDVGRHLGILSQYFWGYDVTFVGSLVGAVWAFAVGYVGVRLICGIYNTVTKR